MSPASDPSTPEEQETPATAEQSAADEAGQSAEAAAEPEATESAAAGPEAAEAQPARKPQAKTAAKPAAAAPRAKAKAVPDVAVEADLPPEIFDVTVNVPLIHQVVVAQRAAARQGTHATKTRGDVRGGGKKPYRQKGTGRARQGSTRAPQFAGGGVVHGPVPRSYAQRTPKKMKAAALRGALSDRARHGLVHVVSAFIQGPEPKTKDALAALTRVTGAPTTTTSVLVVADRGDVLTWKSLRNVPGVHLIDPGQLNTYDVLVSDRVVFTSTALASFVARTGQAGGAEGEER
jgi:large subunit ribosomal protein L4